MVSCNVHIKCVLRVVFLSTEIAGVRELMWEVYGLQVVLAISPRVAVLVAKCTRESTRIKLCKEPIQVVRLLNLCNICSCDCDTVRL